MRKKCAGLIMVVIVSSNAFLSSFVYVEAKDGVSDQPEVCNGPSEMMSNYFNFQREAITIVMGSDINSVRYSTSFKGGLFTEKVLKLKTTTAIDLLATNTVSILESFVSSSTTTTVLFLLAYASVWQSSVEGLAILYKDRPVVRDYKEMLEIETEWFNVAYFRSKQMSLTSKFESDMQSEFSGLIKKYQDLGLFNSGTVNLGSENMANIISSLVAMNAVMKHFIMVGGKSGRSGLEKYAWCASDMNDDCSKSDSVLKFSRGAIDRLYNDYREVRVFGKCNNYSKLIKSRLNKTIKNNGDLVKSSVDDMKVAVKRLGAAVLGKGSWNFKNGRKNMCEGISDYEMAQLRAYRGPEWDCGDLLNANVNVSSFILETRDYSNKKQAQAKTNNQISSSESAGKPTLDSPVGNVADKMEDKITAYDMEYVYISIIGGGEFNSDFLFDMNNDFREVFEDTTMEIWQAQENAISADITDLFPRGKGILDQMDSVIKVSGSEDRKQGLKNHLQQIEDKQCTG